MLKATSGTVTDAVFFTEVLGDDEECEWHAEARHRGLVRVCAGPPTCGLEGEQAIDAQKAGCTMCRRIIIEAGGTQTEHKAKPQ